MRHAGAKGASTILSMEVKTRAVSVILSVEGVSVAENEEPWKAEVVEET